jgi:hypothetical protein
MYTSDDLVSAAKAIRPLLPELLDLEAEQVDQQLAELIDRLEAGESVQNQIAMLLASYEPTRKQMEKLLPGKQQETRYSDLPGMSTLARPPKYVCPDPGCAHVWYRHQIGQTIPTCPVHRLSLVPIKE